MELMINGMFLSFLFFFILMLIEGYKSSINSKCFLLQNKKGEGNSKTMDLGTMRFIELLSNNLKKERTGFCFAFSMVTAYFFLMLYCVIRKGKLELLLRSFLSVRISYKDITGSDLKNGNITKILKNLKGLSIDGKKFVVDIERGKNDIVIFLTIEGYIRLRFHKYYEKTNELSRNSGILNLVLPNVGEEIELSKEEFNIFFCDYSVENGYKRCLKNIKEDFVKAKLDYSFDYSIDGSIIRLKTIRV